MSSATWTMELDQSTHWFSLVSCEHGASRSGVWLAQPIRDDRNLLSQAEPGFANHRALHPECDCDLVLGWQPTFVPAMP